MNNGTQSASKTTGRNAKDFLQLTKPSLTVMVVFSSVVSYLLAPGVVDFDWLMITLLFAGGYLVTGSANAINQTVERDTDAVMKRTGSRPIAAGRMKPSEGWAFAVVTGVAGVATLTYFFNPLSGALAAVSLFLYAFVYTPLKKVSAVAVLVGAIPGALPCLIGWAAGNDAVFPAEHGSRDWGGWILFGIQFLWQFPHFWAIAWIAHNDYAGAGFKLLPADKGPTKFTAAQTIVYAVLLLPICVLPYVARLTDYGTVGGKISLGVVLLANVFLIAQCVGLYRKMDAASARRVMFGSYLYLPAVLLALLAAKA